MIIPTDKQLFRESDDEESISGFYDTFVETILPDEDDDLDIIELDEEEDDE
jgi:hypothetical protein